MERVNLDVVKPWITAKLNEILGIEDDVVIEYVFSQLEEKTINPKVMQINLTGFLNARRAREFMGELWSILLEAQNSEDGIPASFVEKKMKELQEKSDDRRQDRSRDYDRDREGRDRDRRDRDRDGRKNERDRDIRYSRRSDADRESSKGRERDARDDAKGLKKYLITRILWLIIIFVLFKLFYIF
uniref:PWI domain-containing protein n=1 Tax=Syphacia muris TaxID=451379 RepID=A0A0N5AC82_9BILA